MSSPKDKNNFVIEVTKDVMAEINHIYMNSDIEPVVELHYSPYWKEMEDDSNE